MPENYFARFKILDEIGFGGMGLVYQAYDPDAGRNVAIKVLPPEYIHDLGLRANFEQEVRLISSLNHESIVPVLEYGTFQGQPYLIMPYMPNGSLADRLIQRPFPPNETAEILDRLAKALDYTHQQGIVHRDLKPSNILFGEDGSAFLADFGIALQNQAAWSINGIVRGSPAYLSPEQALRAESIDRRSDIYSLGIIVYEMLTGVKPFQGDVPMVVVLKQIHDEPPLLRSVNQQIPAAVEEVVLRAISKDVHDRYQSAGDFAAAFQQALNSTEESSSALDARLDMEAAANSEDVSLTEQLALEQDASHAEETVSQIGEDGTPAQTPQPGWSWHQILALGIVLWAGLAVGIGSAAIVRRVQASTPPNVQVVIDESGVTLTNISQAPLDLSSLSFRRVSNSDLVDAEFQAAQWDRLPEPGKEVLPAGACYQLLLPDSGPLTLITGTPQPRPPDCQDLVGWLAADQPGWEFWLPQIGETTFQVIQDDKLIKTCPTQAGQCEFFLAQP
jgi:serine/threonine protein kinase